MGKKIASLYAEIGADTTKLKSGLDYSKKSLTGMQGTMTGVGKAFNSAWGQITIAAGVASAAFATTKMAVDSVVDPTMELALQVRDLARASGMGAEETSKLIQVFDDLNVDVSVLDQALRKMSQEGITFSIDKMAEMSDEYLRLADGAERNKFLLDSFGRSGLDMARAMEAGGDAIKKMAAEMNGSLILTQDNLDAARKYEIELDRLEDTILGIKVSIGNKLIPVMVELLDTFLDARENTVGLTDAINDSNNPMIAYAYETNKATLATLALAQSGDDMVESWTTNWQESQKVTSAYQAQAEAADTLYSSTSSLNTIMKEYSTSLLFNEAVQGLNEDQARLLAESLGLIVPATDAAMGMLETFSAQLDIDSAGSLAEYNRKLADMDEAIKGLQDKHITITQTTIYEEIHRNYEWREDLANGSGSGIQQAGGGPVMNNVMQWQEYGRMEQYMRPGENGGFVQNAQQMVETMRAAGINGGGGATYQITINANPKDINFVRRSIEQVQLLAG